MMTRKLYLRWIDFHTNLYQSLEAFLKAEELVDVTLSVGGKKFRAHKLILSICSPVFKDLFLKNPCPIEVLKEVEDIELCKLLQFIYHGEVHVTQQELNPFLETLEFLQIKGLSSVREKNQTASAEVNDKEVKEEPNPATECKTEIKDEIVDIEPPIDSVSESIQSDNGPISLKHYIESTSNEDSSRNAKKARPYCDSSITDESSKEIELLEPKIGTDSSDTSETIKNSGSSSKTTATTGFKCVYIVMDTSRQHTILRFIFMTSMRQKSKLL